MRTPVLTETIVRSDLLAAAFNADKMMRDGKRLVDLACGHKAYTRAFDKASCPRCREMLRRSLIDGREDYEGFRKGLVRDTMEWRADPCRQFNEKTDLAGRFVTET